MELRGDQEVREHDECDDQHRGSAHVWLKDMGEGAMERGTEQPKSQQSSLRTVNA